MLTAEIVEGCARTDVYVNGDKLARWARQGWLASPVRHGLGQGRGVEWRWQADSLPRAILVARAVTPGHDSRLRVSRVLVGGGYSVPPSDLRSLLLEDIARLVTAISKRQTYLKRDLLPSTKRRRLNEMIDRRLSGYPSPIVEAVEAVCEALMQVAPERATNIFDEAARCFSPALWSDLLNEVADDRLSQILSISFQMLPLALLVIGSTLTQLAHTASAETRRVIGTLPPLIVPLQGRILTDSLLDMGRDETVIVCQLMAGLYLPSTLAGIIATTMGTQATQPVVIAMSQVMDSLGIFPPDIEAVMSIAPANATFNSLVKRVQTLMGSGTATRASPARARG